MLCLKQFCDLDSYESIPIERVGMFPVFGTDKFFYYLYSMWFVARWRPAILHCQGLNAAFFLWFYRLWARRIVVRYGSADYVNDKWGGVGKLGFRLCEWQLRWADAVIAVTPSLRQRLIDNGITSRVWLIPNALDTPQDFGAAEVLARFRLEPGRFVLSVGRVTAQKDFETLVRAFEAARADGADLDQLVIVGGDDGSGYRARLGDIAGPDVVFTDRLPRAQVEELYAHCRLYVNSSRHEGMSNAILEALSYACPIVVSDIVENRDLQLAPHHYFPVGDVDMLATRLIEAGREPAAFQADRARFWQWPDVVGATLNIYEQVTADRTGRLHSEAARS